MTPSHLVIFLKGDFLRISSGLEVMLGFFVSPSSVCLNYLDDDFTEFGVLELFWDRQNCELARLEFAVLVIFVFRLGSKLPCLFPFLFHFLVRFRFSRTPCRFFSSFLSRGRRAVSILLFFLADAVPFLFLFCTV